MNGEYLCYDCIDVHRLSFIAHRFSTVFIFFRGHSRISLKELTEK